MIKNDYAVPVGSTLQPLTEELFSFISSTDPDLRDSIDLEVFYNWLERGRYHLEDLRGFIYRLLANLQEGLGEKEGDGVFQHSYFLAEQDCRGFDRAKSFAHSIAHAVDLFSALAASQRLGEGKHLQIFNCIAAKMKATPDWIFIYG